MTDGAQDRPLDSSTSRTSPAWLNVVAPMASGAALCVLGFLGLIVLVDHFSFEPRLRNLLVFAISVSVLPAACATIQRGADKIAPRAASRLFESINVWCAMAALLVLAFVGVATWQSGAIDFWQENALQAARTVLGLYLALLAIVVGLGFWLGLAPEHPKPAYLNRPETAVLHFDTRSVQTIAFAYAFVVATIALFRIEPANSHYNGLFSIFFPATPGGFPSSSRVIVAALLAISATVIAVLILIAERRLERRDPVLLLRLQKLGLPLAAAAAVFFFDFSLATDALHYMTNIGPALHMMSGGTLMVDSFSQYGPGPVLLEYLAFQFGAPSFGAANIAVQLCNILFYILFLVALWQSTRHRLAALWLGLLVLTFWLSGWSYGDGNVNAAPSVLGVRYLPPMLMAVALGACEGKRHSVLTFLASFLAACWSMEAVAGVLALHCGFLALLNLRDRSFGRLVVDVALACLPILAGLATMSAGIWLASGKLPAFAIYLGFFGSYNPMATYWALPFDGLFWGWIPMLLAIMVVLGICCQTAIFGRQGKLPHWTDHWLRHCLPAALLTTLTAAYFAGRAVDYVILIALLPFSLLLIPASLWLVNVAAHRNRIAASLSAIPLIAFIWMSSFSLLYLFRVGAPYSLLVQECRDHGRCTPAALAGGMAEALRFRPVLDRGTTAWSTNVYDDRGIVAEALSLMNHYAAKETRLTVLLGKGKAGDSILSDVALMYAHRWHTWPRSFTLTDELVPALVARILAAPVVLRTGDVIFHRPDETNLGPLESKILNLVRSTGSLCSLEGSSPDVSASRFWKNGDPQPTGGCMDPLVRAALEISKAETVMLQALPAFIRNIQGSGDALPDGRIDLAALRHASVEIPSQFVRGQELASFWGDVILSKAGRYLTLDLSNTSPSICRALLTAVSRVSGVVRVATTATQADERETPVTDEQATEACTQHPGFIRLIMDAHP